MFTCFITLKKTKKPTPYHTFILKLKSQFGQAILQSKQMTWQKGWCYGFFHLLEFHSVKGQLSQEAGSIPWRSCCLEKFSWRQDAFARFHSTAPNRPGAWMHFCIYGAAVSVPILSDPPVCVCVRVCVSKRCSHQTVLYQHSNCPWRTHPKNW